MLISLLNALLSPLVSRSFSIGSDNDTVVLQGSVKYAGALVTVDSDG